MLTKKFVLTSHSFGAKKNLKNNFVVNVKVGVDKRFRRDADTDDLGGKIPIDFGLGVPN